MPCIMCSWIQHQNSCQFSIEFNPIFISPFVPFFFPLHNTFMWTWFYKVKHWMCNPLRLTKSSLVVFTHSHCLIRIKIAYVHSNDGCQYLLIVEEQGIKIFEITFVNFFLKITFRTLMIIFFLQAKDQC